MRLKDAYTKITDTTATARAAAASPKPREAAPATDGASHGVHVTLSNEARALADKADANFDSAKVARLHQAVSEGTLKVDSHAIAKKLVEGA